MELVTLLTADYANVTQEGKFNVMGIFDRIVTTGFPARHPEMVLAMKLVASPAEYNTQRKLNVKLINADATVTVMDWSKDLSVGDSPTGDPVEINQFLTMRGLVFPAPGVYAFYVKVDNDEKGHVKITLQPKD